MTFGGDVERFQYDNRIVKNFLFVTILWGAVGMLVGLIAALQENFRLYQESFGPPKGPLH